MLSICRILAAAGWEVRTLCTSAFDTAQPDAVQWHRAQGLDLRMHRVGGCSRPLWRFAHGGVAHCLMDTPGSATNDWMDAMGSDFERAFDVLLRGWRPDVMLTYGGSPCLKRCRRKVRQGGGVVVLGLRNHGYFNPGAMTEADRGLAPSEWMAARYAEYFGRPIDGIPSPLIESEVRPEELGRAFFTFVNPSRAKGMLFFIRLADELSNARPDIPLLIVDSHGLGQKLVQAAAERGIDLRAHQNIMLAPTVAMPKHFLRLTRAVLVPSLWEEPFGRVAAEALLCGIPALVSDRGGLPEAVGGAGGVLPIPRDIAPDAPTLPPAEDVQPWLGAILRLADDEAYYRVCCARAQKEGERYAEAVLARRYVDYFDSLASGD
jgi:glycosyltransferase involved in cell wall biosynthesis